MWVCAESGGVFYESLRPFFKLENKINHYGFVSLVETFCLFEYKHFSLSFLQPSSTRIQAYSSLGVNFFYGFISEYHFFFSWAFESYLFAILWFLIPVTNLYKNYAMTSHLSLDGSCSRDQPGVWCAIKLWACPTRVWMPSTALDLRVSWGVTFEELTLPVRNANSWLR